MNLYIVTFDRDPQSNYSPFHDCFVKNAKFVYWWHHIKSAYIVATEASADYVSEHFSQCALQHGISRTHLVVKLDLSRRHGWLDKDAWAWIKKRAARGSD